MRQRIAISKEPPMKMEMEETYEAPRNGHSNSIEPYPPAKSRYYLHTYIILGLGVLISIFIGMMTGMYYGVMAWSLLPVILSLFVALQQQKQVYERIIPLVTVITIFSGFLPNYISSALVAIGLTLFGILTRPRKDSGTLDSSLPKPSTRESSTPSPLTNLFKAALLLTVVMLTENFLVWVVSATFIPGQNVSTTPDPLQDNGRAVLNSFLKDFGLLTKREIISFRRMWNVQNVLVSTLGASLCLAEFHPTRQLWSVGTRTLLTLACARIIRTISFVLTVLPSQHTNCYSNHYPNPPPSAWLDWILVGVEPASNGGCNDLIISGHATVTATLACLAISMANDNVFTFALWWLVAMDYAVEIYEGFHYSVDMWLGAVVVSMLWRILKTVEDDNKSRNKILIKDLTWGNITIQDVLQYGIPTFIGFMQVSVLSNSSANPLIVGFGLATFVQVVVLRGSPKYTMHLLYCLLYVALGIYL